VPLGRFVAGGLGGVAPGLPGVVWVVGALFVIEVGDKGSFEGGEDAPFVSGRSFVKVVVSAVVSAFVSA
jgi:hypothetical protein